MARLETFASGVEVGLEVSKDGLALISVMLYYIGY